MEERAELEALADRSRYGGNPEHKRNPGDFGLTPPSSPRPAKTLCDDAGVSRREAAHELLRSGIRDGLVSQQSRGNWPQNVWAVSDGGVPFEASLENQETGTYHGYPMMAADPLRAEIKARWEARS